MAFRNQFKIRFDKLDSNFIYSQLDLYDSQKGLAKKWNIYSDVQDIRNLREFCQTLKMKDNEQKNHSLDPAELNRLYEILSNARTIPGHESDIRFNNLKRWFGIERLHNLNALKKFGLLNEKTVDMMMHVNHYSMANAIKLIWKTKLNTLDIWDEICDAEDPYRCALQIAKQAIENILNLNDIDLDLFNKKFVEEKDYIFIYKIISELHIKQDILDFIQHQNPIKFGKALRFMNVHSFLKEPKYYEMIKEAQNPELKAKQIYAIDHIFSMIKDSEIDTENNRKAIIAHPNVIKLEQAIESLLSRMMTQSYFDMISEHSEPHKMANAITILQNNPKIDTLENKEKMKQHSCPDVYLNHILARDRIKLLLESYGINTGRNLGLLNKHSDPESLEKGLLSLKGAYVLTSEYFAAVAQHARPLALAQGIIWLHYLNNNFIKYFVDIDFVRNLELIQQEDNPHKVAVAIAVDKAKNNINGHRWLSYILNKIVDFQPEFVNYYKEIMVEAFNSSVNFNTQKVEAVASSSSNSAKKLLTRYQSHLILENQISELKKWAEHLDEKKTFANSKQIELTQLSIDYICGDKYFYFDPESRISLNKLLALIWLAIHDTNIITISVENAESLLINVLAEIAEKNNFVKNTHFCPPKKLPCKAFAFDTLIEKFVGVHPDIEAIVVSKLNAKWELPAIVKTVIINTFAFPKNENGLITSRQFVDLLESKGTAAIWDQIKDKVEQQFYEKFNSLFRGKNDPEFIQLLNEGKTVEFDGIKELKQQLEQYSAAAKLSLVETSPSAFFQPAPVKLREIKSDKLPEELPDVQKHKKRSKAAH